MSTLTKYHSLMNKYSHEPEGNLFEQNKVKEIAREQGQHILKKNTIFDYNYPHFANLISLSSIRDYETLSRFDIITSTDGPIPIVDFFIRFARPGNYLKTVILIAKEFQSIVPEVWSENVLFYEVKTYRENLSRNILHKFFITVNDSKLVPFEDVINELNDIKSFEVRNVPLSCHISDYKEKIIPNHEKETPYEIVREVSKILEPEDRFISFEDILNFPNPESCIYKISNKINNWRYFCEFEHHLLSKGMIPTQSLSNKSNDENEKIRLSAHHFLEIEEIEIQDNKKLWDDINKYVSKLGTLDKVEGSDLAIVINELFDHS